MALGTITIQNLDPALSASEPGGARGLGVLTAVAANVVGDGAYSAGGSKITAAQLGLNSKVLMADVAIVTPIATVLSASAVVNADGSINVKTYSGTGTTPNIGLVEATGTANQSGLVFQVQAFGI